MSSTLSQRGGRPGSGTRPRLRAAASNVRTWAPRVLFSLAVAYAACGLATGWWPLAQ